MNMDYDVIIAGAGLSGIGMACHLQKNNPNKSFAILERRQAMGGPWDLFRYPGIRPDSDKISFGYNFSPWIGKQVLPAGASIKQYIQDTAQKFGVDKNIRYSMKIISANFSTKTNRWTVDVLDESNGETHKFTCNYFISATGYYNHDQGHSPTFKGSEDLKEQIIHPQFCLKI